MGSLFFVEAKFRRLHWLVAARKVQISFARLRRKAGFNPDQPRDKYGRWSDGDEGSGTEAGSDTNSAEGINDSRILSGAALDEDPKPDDQYAQNTPRNPNRSRAQPPGTPAQETQLAVLRSQADQAIARIQEIDANWRPSPSLSNPDSIEGAIAAERGTLAEAQSRLDELRTGIGGNFGPPLDSLPRSSSTIPSSRPFDGPALIDAYRAASNMPDLFGNPAWPSDKDTVAVTTLNNSTVFGVNSGAPGYETSDRAKAAAWRWALINDDPDVVEYGNIGQIPYNSLYHAEATVLIRSAEQNGGTLAGKTLEIYVDREMCVSCERVLPRLGLKLGDPVVIFQDSSGSRKTMWNGSWLKEPAE